MPEYILKTNNLTKAYHGVYAIKDVSVSLKAGRIYALIGRNGAGKSTFMRLIAGLSYPTYGSIELFGLSGEKALRSERKRIGCMIEYPSQDVNMTALENMRLHRILRGVPNMEIENELLEIVGLSGTDKKKVKNFSLGMKQRLGIAIALIGSPEFLILDEPVNGLDPLGMMEMRNLLIRLSEERQMTILVSSHNLSELYQAATDYIILDSGGVKQMLTLEELDKHCRRYILISSREPEKLVHVLECELNTSNYKVMPDKSVRLYDYLDNKEMVARALYNNEIIATNFSEEGDTLENYFISVIGGAGHD